jgi:hypothetical protein
MLILILTNNLGCVFGPCTGRPKEEICPRCGKAAPRPCFENGLSDHARLTYLSWQNLQIDDMYVQGSLQFILMIKLHSRQCLPSRPSLPNLLKKSLKPPALPTLASLSAEPIVLDDAAVEELCSQTEGLDIEDDPKTKKAKVAEIALLATLGLRGVMEEAKPLKEVQFEAFNPRKPREPKVNIPSYIDSANPLELFDLFIPPEIYTTIAENTNLYAIAHNAPTAPILTNKRY